MTYELLQLRNNELRNLLKRVLHLALASYLLLTLIVAFLLCSLCCDARIILGFGLRKNSPSYSGHLIGKEQQRERSEQLDMQATAGWGLV